MRKKYGDLFLESLGEAEHIGHKKQGYRFGISVGSDGISPGGGINYGRGRGSKYWVEVPAVIKGDELSITVEDKLTLIGGGLIGKESNVKGKVLELTKVLIHNHYRYTQGRFNLNSLKDLYLGKLSRSIIKGWGEFGHEKLNQKGTVHPTITGLNKDNAARLKSITENWEILNTVPEKQIVSNRNIL